MSNLIDIQTQIQKLQKQASEIKDREFDATVRDILAKMEAFGISIKDLQAGTKSKKGRGRPAGKSKATTKATTKTASKSAVKRKSAGKTVAPKYKGPNGETWSGRGLTPRWLAALVAQGQSKESFAIA
jgi:DNA-binding protein H-NS